MRWIVGYQIINGDQLMHKLSVVLVVLFIGVIILVIAWLEENQARRKK